MRPIRQRFSITKGWLDLVASRSVAVVGSRKPSRDGLARTRRLVRELVNDDFTVVSGLAAGIDRAAHETAIERNGRTIAVIGTPLSQVYPKEHTTLQRRIAQQFLLVSPVPVKRYESQTYRGNRLFFPERNVVMSALTEATIIVEAGETSGTLIQARAALQQGRKLFILDSCNLGLYTMEKVAPDIAYRRLKYVSDWRLVEENQRAALAAIVHGISRLDAASHWGDGTTSASDGQRFAMPHKVLQRTYSTRFNDFALEFYSFVADNYAPFYSRPIECTDRDAPFVLDGVLYHESDLDLEEHYTDTHGYTEINFAAFVMVGMRFCPRIRSLHRQRIYCADPARDHGVLEPVLQRGRRAVNFRLIAQQWDRIGQFYAAFPAGHATASAALQRLNRFQASNRFYAANRELGRALKTEFVLQYMSEPKLRAKVRRGLLKVEQLHALARAVYYGQRGRISAREVYDQMNACSCLTLILACIVYWQAREISRIAAAPDFPFDPDLLRHVSPIEWKNVILYGEIKIDPAKLKMRGP